MISGRIASKCGKRHIAVDQLQALIGGTITVANAFALIIFGANRVTR
jgi:hypothetical protein